MRKKFNKKRNFYKRKHAFVKFTKAEVVQYEICKAAIGRNIDACDIADACSKVQVSDVELLHNQRQIKDFANSIVKEL